MAETNQGIYELEDLFREQTQKKTGRGKLEMNSKNCR